MPSCEAVEDLMPLFVAGRLEEERQRLLAAHLSACEACQEELGWLFRLRLLLRAAAARHAPSPAELDRVFSSLQAGLTSSDERPTPQGLRERIPFAEHIPPLLWALRILDGASALGGREWTIQVGSLVAVPAKGS